MTDVPLFVSDTTLRRRKSLPRALGRWAKDSGGFTELSMHGSWTQPAKEYARRTEREMAEIGGLDWAAPQDWMCEEHILRKTGLAIDEHQARTVRSFLELRDLAPGVPWAPVIQGWSFGDYLRCVDLYAAAGVDLSKEPAVGVGSVCRRQHTGMAASLMTVLGKDLRLHGFGFKVQGLRSSVESLCSADSLAWSFNARREPPISGHDKPGPGRPKGHINCANCLQYALEWRESLLGSLGRARQLSLALES